MPVRFENYKYSYDRNGKPVFAPSDRGEKIGREVKALVEQATEFDPFFYHFRKGGHVSALHHHRELRFFARVDIERFFYSVARNRVARALYEIGVPRAGHYAKWSTVKNPYNEPRYALPYGFVQSPILATLVLMRSSVAGFLRQLPNSTMATVYVDDIALGSDDKAAIDAAFAGLLDALAEANFSVNANKTHPPADAITLFNCDLTHQRTVVTEERRTQFYLEERSGASSSAFERYCDNVAAGNVSGT